jgi:hypothetical protein
MLPKRWEAGKAEIFSPTARKRKKVMLRVMLRAHIALELDENS